jgi:polyhydroxybutyrate depolymerase
MLCCIGILMFGSMAHAQQRCGIDAACQVPGGQYRASPPPGWDGRARLPTGLFFHGFRGSAADSMADTELRRDFAQAGILLILPDGLDGTWAHRASPRTASPGARDELAFIAAIMADIRSRWPVDETRLFASGFSQGASMVWDLACHAGGFRAYIPVAGAFWEPYPTTCPGGPANLLHIHGLADPTIPLEGRALRGGAFVQGNLFSSFAILITLDECQRHPESMEPIGIFTLRRWDRSCRSGRRIAMALHPGTHEMPLEWLALARHWMNTLP